MGRKPHCFLILLTLIPQLLIIALTPGHTIDFLPRLDPDFSNESANSSKESLVHQLRIAKSCFAKNIVLQRGTLALENLELTPWTVHARTYTTADSRGTMCSSIEQIAHSLKYGQRHFVHAATDDALPVSMSSLQKHAATAFQPSGCNYIWPSRLHACKISQTFHRIIFLGDSLIRQTHRAFTMFLREDFEYGGLPYSLPPLKTFNGENISIYDDCRCDGQLSEHMACRFNGALVFEDNRQKGICSFGMEHFALQFISVFNKELALLRGNTRAMISKICTQASPGMRRPVQLILGTGSRFHCNATETIELFITPIAESIKRARAVCPDVEVSIIWISRGVQDRAVDEIYPYQSREQMLVFNEQIDSHFKEVHAELGVVILDVWNLTQGARTSDGVHYLSDVNLVQAAYIINVMGRRGTARYD